MLAVLAGVALWAALQIRFPSQSDYELGVIWQEQKQYAKAIKHFERALETNPENVDAIYDLADIYAELTDTEKAIEFYRQGLEKDPVRHPRAYNNLAVLLLSTNDISNTLVLLAKAEQNIVTTVPEERWAQLGAILKNRAWAYWKNGLYPQAMELIEKAQKLLGPAQKLGSYPEVFCLHALIAAHTGNPEPAEQECITRFEADQEQPTGSTYPQQNKSIFGITYELYLLVLKQRTT
jgi:tetratricopeptide (TPR) repeat protein